MLQEKNFNQTFFMPQHEDKRFNLITLPTNYGNKKKLDCFKIKYSSSYILLFLLFYSHFLFGCIESCSNFKKESKIELDKNGYRNILIAIDENTEENIDLIQRIKETFTDASKLLFSITK